MATVLTFPGQYRPHAVETGEPNTDHLTLTRLTAAAEAANAAALDCAGSIQHILLGNRLGGNSHILSGETLTSVLQAALPLILLRGMRNGDRIVFSAICDWLESDGGNHG